MKRALSLFVTVAVCLQGWAWQGVGDAEADDYSKWPLAFSVEYLPSRLVYVGEDREKDDYQSFGGLALTMTGVLRISTTQPLYLEAGLGFQRSYYSVDIDYADDGWNFSLKEEMRLMSLKMPVSLAYVYSVSNSRMVIVPYAGLRFRYNVWGQLLLNNIDRNLFDIDDMEGDEDSLAKRFQVGWQAGAKVRFGGRFFVGAAYGTDFNEISHDVKVHEAQFSLGIVF